MANWIFNSTTFICVETPCIKYSMYIAFVMDYDVREMDISELVFSCFSRFRKGKNTGFIFSTSKEANKMTFSTGIPHTYITSA